MTKLFFAMALLLASFAAFAQQASELGKQDLAKLVPQNYFFAGQTASTQTRNAGGVKVGDKMVLFALVDNSGYSTGVQQKYQGLLITQVPLKVGDKTIPPGSYGFGTPSADHFNVLDINANEIAGGPVSAASTDQRAVPLRVTSKGDSVVLSLGKRAFTFGVAQQ
jgi:hypothetical protein